MDGMEKGMEKVAIKLLKDGMSLEKVARYVDKPVQWVEDLIASAK